MSTEGNSRKKAQRLVGMVILLLLFILGSMLLYSQLEEESLPEIIEKIPENVDLSLDRVHYSQNDNGIESWVLDADRAAYQRKESELALIGLEMTFFNAGKFGDLTLNAATGNLHQQQKTIDFQGDVQLVTTTGEQIHTETLEFDYAKKIIRSSDPVRMYGRQVDLAGTGMTIELIPGKLRLHDDVHALFFDEGDPQ